MSHTCFHVPHSFELAPLEVTPARYQTDNVCQLKIRQKAHADWQYLLPIYATQEVRELCRSGDVTGFDVHALPVGSKATRVLPGQPAYVVLGVELRDGTRRCTVPRELVRARNRALGLTAAVLFAGLALSAWAPWLGGCIAALSTHAARTARSLSLKPF